MITFVFGQLGYGKTTHLVNIARQDDLAVFVVNNAMSANNIQREMGWSPHIAQRRIGVVRDGYYRTEEREIEFAVVLDEIGMVANNYTDIVTEEVWVEGETPQNFRGLRRDTHILIDNIDLMTNSPVKEIFWRYTNVTVTCEAVGGRNFVEYIQEHFGLSPEQYAVVHLSHPLYG